MPPTLKKKEKKKQKKKKPQKKTARPTEKSDQKYCELRYIYMNWFVVVTFPWQSVGGVLSRTFTSVRLRPYVAPLSGAHHRELFSAPELLATSAKLC